MPLKTKSASTLSPADSEGVIKQLLRIIPISLARFAEEIEVSPSHAHALKEGERAITPKIARILTVKFGVHPGSLKPKVKELRDCDSQPYTEESFKRHQAPTTRELNDTEVEELMIPLKHLLLASAKAGRLNVVKLMLRQEIESLVREVDGLQEAHNELELERLNPSNKLTLDMIRKMPDWAKLIGFIDDPSKPGDTPYELKQPEADVEPKGIFSETNWPPIIILGGKNGVEVIEIEAPCTSTKRPAKRK